MNRLLKIARSATPGSGVQFRGEVRRKELVDALEGEASIVSAEFCPLRYHLMLVRYDRDVATSQDVLARVKSQNYQARLIGPV